MPESESRKSVVIYADGACSGNPGPGGYGAVMVCGDHSKLLTQGYTLTTNNRMELRGVIAALESLKEVCTVKVVTDSQYVVNGITLGWARGWRANGWKKKDKKPAINPDLWSSLLDMCEKHQVTFEWIRGHNGHPMNEKCDEMAVAAYRRSDKIKDVGYGA